MHNKFDLRDEVFFNRSTKVFPYILYYLRTGKIDYKPLTIDELVILKDDAKFYGLISIFEKLNAILRDIEYVRY
jgi:hypothetical protein